ncbi:MAG: cold shock and DUF1294 domain-containing protein [Devosia sp.]
MLNRPTKTGQIVDWHDAAGYGFIEDSARRERLFFHISEMAAGGPRPAVGDQVTYVIGIGRDGRPAATQVRVRGAAIQHSRDDRSMPQRIAVRLTAAAVLTAVVAAMIITGRAGSWLIGAYGAMGSVCLAAYAFDKRAAKRGDWRTSENTLHGIDLLFGIIGGLVAQALLHHKTSKLPFAVTTWLIYAMHVAGLGFLLFGGQLPRWTGL